MNSGYEDIDPIPRIEWDEAGFLTKWTFSAANSMLQRGLKSPLQFDDLMLLPEHDKANRLISHFEEAYRDSKSFCGIPRLVVALWKSHRSVFNACAFYTFLEGAFRIASPVILGYFLADLQDPNSPRSNIFLWALALSIFNLCQAFVHHVLFYFTMRLGYNFKTSTVGMIFDTLFKIPGGAFQSNDIDTGVLVNMISNDVARFDESSVFFHFLWEPILELIAIQILLSLSLNFYAGLAGVGMTVLFIPVQLTVARRFAGMRRQVAGMTDKRVRHMSEAIQGIASVKSFGWENPFFALLGSIRRMEVQNITTALDLRAINYALYFCSPHVASFATFMVYINTGGTLTLPLVYTTLSLLQILRLVMGRMWTRAIETCSESTASCHRIETFLSTAEKLQQHSRPQRSHSLNADNVPQHELELPRKHNDDTISASRKLPSRTVVAIPSKTSFSHGTDCVTLTDIQLSVSPGEVVMIVGPVGAGKSSLLAAILGDMAVYHRRKPMDTTSPDSPVFWSRSDTRIAYCAQRPWIVASTVKANITLAGKAVLPGTVMDSNAGEVDFKKPIHIDEQLYGECIEQCRLVEDLQLWPAADNTEIGERGVSVSGGQKARISLARAVYSDSDLYLLDDPLSAVDAHVGRSLFFDCIIDYLKIKKNKAVILATHQVQYLEHADKVLVLDKEGHQAFFGTYLEFSERISEFSYVKPEASLGLATGGDADAFSENGTVSSTSERRRRNSSVDFVESVNGSVCENSIGTAGDDEMDIVEDAKQKHVIIQTEDRITGKVTYRTYLTFLRSGGVVFGVLAFFYAIAGQLLSMLTDYWLRWWASGNFGDDQSSPMYQGVFGLLVVLTIVVGYHKAMVWLHYSLNASSNLHTRCLWAVLHSPVQFFIANPTGRILNRFAKDQNQIDEMFPSTFFDFVQCTLFCVSALLLACISLPWMILLMPPLFYMFISFRSTYIKSSREIKRIEALTRSPIYADFSAALEGIQTLRAYKLEKTIISSFRHQLDANTRVWISFLMTSRWLGFRLDFLSVSVVISMAFLCAALKGSFDVGLVGFALVYTLSLSGLAQWTVRQSAEVENQMTAIERIDAYSYLPQEKGYKTSLESYMQSCASSASVPARNSLIPQSPDSGELMSVSSPLGVTRIMKSGGDIIIKDLSVTYREDLNPVLKKLNMHIWAGCKAGICGRTGSGKSSLLLALLRLNIITEGDIILDGKSLVEMSIEEARSHVSIIPQDPHLFSGTIRFNIDPFDCYSDQDLWNALEDAHIKDTIAQNPLGLSAMVEEGGKNFSVGQRQLLSLARAIVRKSEVVLMDEVTASIDYATDKLIQETIRTSEALRHATIITVAHRLRTIADSDLICVIESGSLVEIGSPSELLSNPKSSFRELAEESNEFDEIFSIASAKKST